MMMRSQIQKTAFWAGLVALAAIVSAGAARAGAITIFTNFGPGQSFNTAIGYVVSGASSGDQVVAMPFTAGSTADLADAVLALGNYLGTNSPITLDLESNGSGDVPGSILATLTQQGTIPPFSSAGPVTFDYTGTSVGLTSGTSYWLVASEADANSQQAWMFSNSDTGNSAYNHSGSATGPWSTESGTISAFQVDGTTVATTPEPGTFSLFALAIVCALGALWVERRRKLSRCA